MDALLPHEAAALGRPVTPTGSEPQPPVEPRPASTSRPESASRPSSAPPPEPAAPAGPNPYATLAAGLLLVAGVLHILLIEPHMAHARAAGLFFLVLGAAQIVWALLYLVRPSPALARVALWALIAAPVALWIVTRIWRAPWHGGPEGVDMIGVAVQLLQLGAAAALLWPQGRRAVDGRTAAVLGVGVLVGLAGYGAALIVEDVPWLSTPEGGHGSHDHGHAGGGHGDHDSHSHGSILFQGTRGEPMVGTLSYFGPSTGQALQATCSAHGSNTQECWLSYLQHLLAAEGAVRAFDVLVELTLINSVADANSHPMAHVLGHQAYHAYGLDVALTMRECSFELFQGCHHGALEAYFQDIASQGRPIDQGILRSVCADQGGSFQTYVCEHGMGHGVMMHTGNDLHGSLDLCAKLQAWASQQNCYGGVFMENVVGYLDAQKPGYVPHDHGQGPPVFWVDRNDHAYPCNVVKEPYRDSCWKMQTSLVLHFNGGDFRAASAVCDEAGPQRLPCYNSLGRDAAPYAKRDPAGMSQRCSYGDAEAEAVCVKAFTAGVILQLNSPQAGLDVCAALPGHQKEPCYWEAGRFAASMIGGAAGAALCDAVEADYVATCHEGRNV